MVKMEFPILFQWLAKAFGAYGVQGALSDVVNLICAMMSRVSPMSPSPAAAEVQGVVEQFVQRHRAPGLDLWLPTHMIHDAELAFAMPRNPVGSR